MATGFRAGTTGERLDVELFGDVGDHGHHVQVLDFLIAEGNKDRDRSWLRRTTGGLLVAVVVAAIVGGVLVDLLGS